MEIDHDEILRLEKLLKAFEEVEGHPTLDRLRGTLLELSVLLHWAERGPMPDDEGVASVDGSWPYEQNQRG